MARLTKRDQRVATIMSALEHPLRRRLLQEVAGTVAGRSPKNLAATLKEPLTNVSYHMRELADKGLIKERRTQQRRGAVEHYYVLTPSGKLALVVDKYVEELIR